MRATRFVWEAMGRPAPRNAEGHVMPPRKLSDDAMCALCGEAAAHLIDDAISDNFTTVTNFSLLYPFGGEALCSGCLWAFRAIQTKAAFYFARCADEHGPAGMFFVGTLPLKGLPGTRPDALSALLSPPPPPFVAVFPAYGLEHGGEQNVERLTTEHPQEFFTVRTAAETAEVALAPHVKTAPKSKDTTWKADSAICWALARCSPPSVPQAEPDAVAAWQQAIASDPAWATYLATVEPHRAAPWFRAAAYPLIKLQAKHTLPYAQVSHDRDHFHLAIDDGPGIVVDVALWRRLRAMALDVLVPLRRCGVGAEDARAALMSLRLPMLRQSPEARALALSLMASWPHFVRAVTPYTHATWWPFFVSLLPMPELVKSNPKEKR